MGWKCPECRNHVSGSKCPYCNPTTCAKCGRGGSVTEIHNHHVSYMYDITVPLCADCHEQVHFDDKRGSIPREGHRELDRLDPLRDDGGRR